MASPAESYRSARRNRARAEKLIWGQLQRIRIRSATVVILPPSVYAGSATTKESDANAE